MSDSEATTNCRADAAAGAAQAAPPEEALRAALGEAAPAVRRYLFGMCGDWHEAEDLAQDVLLRAWAGRAGFDGRARVGTWVFTIARNAWRDRLRRRKTRPETQVTDDAMNCLSPIQTPAAAAARNELADAVARAMDLLPAEQREALALRESRGLKFAEIAAMLGVPVATVKSRVRYALGKLADELTALGFGPEA